MIDVNAALQAMPRLSKFCSVEKLHALVNDIIQACGGSNVTVAGYSREGRAIHHVTFGQGRIKALIVGGPHAMEPIGSLTAFALLTLLKQRHPSLASADVGWHIIPCIDPDGAKLNEGWTQQEFTLDSYMRNRYMQATRDQVDTSFPYQYKKLKYSEPSTEAEVLRSIIDRVRPDFYFPLHNNCLGGAFFLSTRDIGAPAYEQIRELLASLSYPLNIKPPYHEITGLYAPGFLPVMALSKFYDYVEATDPNPERGLQRGGASWDYLEQTSPSTLTFIAELGYLDHADSDSNELTGENLRRFKMRVDAEMKCVAALLLDTWQRTKDFVDESSALYRAIVGGMTFPTQDQIVDGSSPISRYPTRDVLFNPRYDKEMSRGERYNACMEDGGFFFLRTTYQVVRLLKETKCNSEVQEAASILEKAFDDAYEFVSQLVDVRRFRTFEPDILAKVQLGSGLIALNTLLT